MKETKTTRYLDSQGRIILPAHIRKALNLTEGKSLEVSLEDDDTIRIAPVQERCVICGAPLTGKYIRYKDKMVCQDCLYELNEQETEDHGNN